MRGVLSKAPSTLMRFRLKTHAFRCVLIGLPSKIIRSAFSLKTHRCENALEDGSKRKRIHIVLVWTVENVTGACVYSMRTEFNLRCDVQFYRFGTL